jgi:hypothetical protein
MYMYTGASAPHLRCVKFYVSSQIQSIHRDHFVLYHNYVLDDDEELTCSLGYVRQSKWQTKNLKCTSSNK